MARARQLQVGDVVRSSYAAPWTGVVEELAENAAGQVVYLVRPTHDRTGRPIRKAQARVLHAHWLTLVEVG